MGEFDEGFKRLQIILILFLFLFSIATCELVFFGSDTNKDALDTTDIVSTEQPTDLWSGIGAVFSGIINVITFFFQLITFTLPTIPVWMTTIMLPIMMTLIVVEIYLVLDIIYSFVKALPLT